MSRRGRAAGFLILATIAAAGAAAIADGYGSRVARGYGPLRPVVVAAADLAADKPIAPGDLSSALEVRRVPQRFVPPGAIASPGEAIGLAPAADLQVGSYLIAAQLHRPRRRRPDSGLGGSRRAVQIAVSGADSLVLGGADPSEAEVDVVVTTEPTGAGNGRTYVAAAGVPLIALGPGPDGPGPGGLSEATLGLTTSEALRLIAAESFARQMTLLPAG